MGGTRSGRDRGAPWPGAIRLFVAVDLPDGARDAVAEAVAALRNTLPGSSWTERAGWHVTLKFLGAVSPELVDGLVDAIGEVATRMMPFATRLSGVGAFPRRGPARVIWVGLDDQEGRLAGLALAINATLTPWFEPDTRPLHPHVTVARLNPARRPPAAFDTVHVRPAPIHVDRVCLYRSHLGGGSPRYERLAAVPLGGP